MELDITDYRIFLCIFSQEFERVEAESLKMATGYLDGITGMQSLVPGRYYRYSKLGIQNSTPGS